VKEAREGWQKLNLRGKERSLGRNTMERYWSKGTVYGEKVGRVNIMGGWKFLIQGDILGEGVLGSQDWSYIKI